MFKLFGFSFLPLVFLEGDDTLLSYKNKKIFFYFFNIKKNYINMKTITLTIYNVILPDFKILLSSADVCNFLEIFILSFLFEILINLKLFKIRKI